MPSKPDNRRRSGERTRRSILDAAVERFGRDGYKETSVADIARSVGVAPTLVYAYYANKEELFVSAVDEDAGAVIRECVASMSEPEQHTSWQDTVFYTLVAAVEKHALARRILMGKEPEVIGRILAVNAFQEVQALVAQRIIEAQQLGLFRSDIDPQRMAEGGMAITMAMLMATLQIGVASVIPFAEGVTAFFMAAMTPPAR